MPFFSQGGTRAQHSWHCHWPPNNPYSILCAAASVNGSSVVRFTGPVCPETGGQPTLPALSEPPDPAKPPSPAAKPNTGVSETALLSRRTGPNQC